MPSICVTTTRTWEAFPTLDYYRTTKSGGRLEAFVMRNTGAGLGVKERLLPVGTPSCTPSPPSLLAPGSVLSDAEAGVSRGAS